MIIVYGYSKLGAEVAYLLHKDNYKFILVEPNKKEYKFAKKDKYVDTIYQFECYDDKELIKIGIKDKKTKTLFCLHNDFNKNLFVTLSSRKLNQNLQIISLSSSKNETTKLKLAGATTTINPYDIAGMKIFRKLHKSMAVKILDDILYGSSDLQIEEITIQKDTILDGIYFKDLDIIKKYNLILLGMKDMELSSEFIFSSRGINHKIDQGDTIVVLGHTKDINNFKTAIK
jgi:voltage-gated potassium channel